MPRLNYLYCQENKEDLIRVFNIPKNENAPEHLKMLKKPTVYAIPHLPLEDLLKYCAVPVIEPLVLATIFLKHFPEQSIMDQEWKSFGHYIGREQEDTSIQVKLSDLFLVERGDNLAADGLAGSIPTLPEVLFLTCMQFRLGSYVGNDYKEYITNLKAKMTVLGKSPPYKLKGLQNLPKYEGVVEDENLQRVVAGLDMYLMKFPKSKYKVLRMGTITMRLKDMGAWSALRSMYTYVGDEARVQDYVFRWLFSSGIGAELQNLIEVTQETDQLDSYYPYARAMNLIPSSHASVGNNPNLHMIVHIVGTLKGCTRSGHARRVGGAKEGPALKIGLWIAMGLDYADDAYMWYRDEETNEELKTWEEERREDCEELISNDNVSIICSDDGGDCEDGHGGPTVDELRAAESPESFFKLGVEKEWELPPFIYERFQKRVLAVQYRPGTIGAWLKSMLA